MNCRLRRLSVLVAAAYTLISCVTSSGPAIQAFKHRVLGIQGKYEPDPSEAAFVSNIARIMLRRYPTPATAVKAGFIQTTAVEGDRTVVYFNHHFDILDPLHPNFLWYDRANKLAGLDYEYPLGGSAQPPSNKVYPVHRDRWTTVPEHVHLAYRDKNGRVWMAETRVRADIRGKIIAEAQLAADGFLPKSATLLWAYYHPTCWDLAFWLVPNPNGAFAALDPLLP